MNNSNSIEKKLAELNPNFYLKFTTNLELKSKNKIELEIKNIMKNIQNGYILYTYQINNSTQRVISHILIKTPDPKLIEKIKKNLKGKTDPIISKKKIMYQKTSNLVSKITNKKEIIKQDIFHHINSTRVLGINGSVEIEPIVANISRTLYAIKFHENRDNIGFIPGLGAELPAPLATVPPLIA